jgi:hypothetical protein
LTFETSPGKEFERPYLKKPFTKINKAEEWLKVKALSSNPSTTKNKTKVDMSRMNEFIIHISKSLGKFFAQDITV